MALEGREVDVGSVQGGRMDGRSRLVDDGDLGFRAARGDEQDEDERKDEPADGRVPRGRGGYPAVAVPVMFGWMLQTKL